jgi:hypothetical protein
MFRVEHYQTPDGLDIVGDWLVIIKRWRVSRRGWFDWNWVISAIAKR